MSCRQNKRPIENTANNCFENTYSSATSKSSETGYKKPQHASHISYSNIPLSAITQTIPKTPSFLLVLYRPP